MVFSPDSHRLALSDDRAVRVWDIATGLPFYIDSLHCVGREWTASICWGRYRSDPSVARKYRPVGLPSAEAQRQGDQFHQLLTR